MSCDSCGANRKQTPTSSVHLLPPSLPFPFTSPSLPTPELGHRTAAPRDLVTQPPPLVNECFSRVFFDSIARTRFQKSPARARKARERENCKGPAVRKAVANNEWKSSSPRPQEGGRGTTRPLLQPDWQGPSPSHGDLFV